MPNGSANPGMPSEDLNEEPGRPPRWSLSSIYPDFDSPERRAAISELESTIGSLESALIEAADFLSNKLSRAGAASTSTAGDLAPDTQVFVTRILRPLERCIDLAETLKTHAYAAYSTNTTDSRALEELNRLEHFDVDMRRVRTRFRALLAAEGPYASVSATSAGGTLFPGTAAAPAATADLSEYRFVLAEEQRLGGLQLSVELEELAADLSRSGAELWSRLQDTTGATLSTDWRPSGEAADGHRRSGGAGGAEAGSPERKTVVQLRSMAHHPDRSIRRKAYEAELTLWRGMEIPLAHAINGVKGFAVSLDGRRGFRNSLHRAVIESRMSQEGFEKLISACEAALPILHRYLKTKARALGQDKLAFFDIFAPIGAGKTARRFSFAEARRLICRELGTFSPDLGAFAESVFARAWIDAEPRPGKVGGAYCVSFPSVNESRILCNFDGSISSVSTVAQIGRAHV